MMRTLLVRGMLAGLFAGVLATIFAYLFGEASVAAAIGIEEHGHHDHGGGHAEEELVGRGVQSTVGLLTGVGGYGIAVGGIFALVFAGVYGRIGTARPRVTAALLAATAFAVVVLVPFLKYPANPPAVGRPGTIGERTGLYFAFLAISLLVAVAATVLARRFAGRVGGWRAGLLAIAGYVVVVAVAAWLLPVIDEVPAGFPAATLWSFRVSSLGTQLVLWTTVGLVFGALAEKVLTPRERTVPREPALS